MIASDALDQRLNRRLVEQIDIFQMDVAAGEIGGLGVAGEHLGIARRDDERGAGIRERGHERAAEQDGASELKNDPAFE